MKMLGEKTEKAYKELFGFTCPRPKKGIFVNCLMEKFGPLIEDLTKLTIYDRQQNPLWLNQFIKGGKGDREFCKEIVDRYVSKIELEIKKHLRQTKEGIVFYKEGKDFAIKALTFCVLSQKLMKERTKSKKPLSKIKTLLINFTLIYYYLLNDKSVCNASIQQFEEVILQKQRIQTTQNSPVISESNKEQIILKEDYYKDESIEEVLERAIDEPMIISENKPPENEIVLDQLPKIKVDFELSELKSSRRPSFLTRMNHQILSEVINLEDLSNEKLKQLQAFISDYINCQKCIDSYKTNVVTDCPKIRETTKKAIDMNLMEFWMENPEYRYCIALILSKRLQRN